MNKEIQNMIKACKANIVQFKKMGDDAAVKATEQMIAELKELLD